MIELADEDLTVNEYLFAVDASARVQLLDLAVVDAHFAPELLEAALGQLVDAWEQATDGIVGQLNQRVDAEARAELLDVSCDGDQLRMVLRDARLKDWRPTHVTATTVEVQVTVSGVRFVIDAVTRRPRFGSPDQRHDMKLGWSLRRSPSDHVPWQLARSTNPAQAIPGLD